MTPVLPSLPPLCSVLIAGAIFDAPFMIANMGRRPAELRNKFVRCVIMID